MDGPRSSPSAAPSSVSNKRASRVSPRANTTAECSPRRPTAWPRACASALAEKKRLGVSAGWGFGAERMVAPRVPAAVRALRLDSHATRAIAILALLLVPRVCAGDAAADASVRATRAEQVVTRVG